MEQQTHRPHRPSKEKKKHAHTGGSSLNSLQSLFWRKLNCFLDRNPKAFAFANPGRLAKTAARSHDVGFLKVLAHPLPADFSEDKRKKISCTSSRSHTRRTPSTTGHHRWPSRCWEDNSSKVAGQEICEGNAVKSPRADHSRHIEEAAIDICRMSERSRGNGRHVQGGRHSAAHD